jgi:hypothetical protein
VGEERIAEARAVQRDVAGGELSSQDERVMLTQSTAAAAEAAVAAFFPSTSIPNAALNTTSLSPANTFGQDPNHFTQVRRETKERLLLLSEGDDCVIS